jgi:hypothetical protein
MLVSYLIQEPEQRKTQFGSMHLPEFLMEACTHLGPLMPGFNTSRYSPGWILSVQVDSLQAAPLREWGAHSMKKRTGNSGGFAGGGIPGLSPSPRWRRSCSVSGRSAACSSGVDEDMPLGGI